MRTPFTFLPFLVRQGHSSVGATSRHLAMDAKQLSATDYPFELAVNQGGEQYDPAYPGIAHILENLIS